MTWWQRVMRVRAKGARKVPTTADDLFYQLMVAGATGFFLRGFFAQLGAGHVMVAMTALAAFLLGLALCIREFRQLWKVVKMTNPNTTDNLPRGLLPPLTEEEAPRLHFSNFLRSDFKSYVVPPIFDYRSEIASWPMYLNNKLGCCTAADAAHQVQVYTQYGQDKEVRVSDSDVLSFYKLCSGYDGTPATDRGAVMQKVQDQFRKVGIGGHKIAAFFKVDNSDLDEVRAGLYLFGGIAIGFPFPVSAMKQFNAGKPWTVDNSLDNSIDGGHDVLLVGIDDDYLYVITWGKVQRVTRSFWSKYMCSSRGEGWVRASQEWINNNTGLAPTAMNVTAINQAFTELTGSPGPFKGVTPVPAPSPSPAPPAPKPTPTPTPIPGPTPVPAVDQASVTFAGQLRVWLDSKTRQSGKAEWLFVPAAKLWLKTRGL